MQFNFAFIKKLKVLQSAGLKLEQLGIYTKTYETAILPENVN